MVVVPLTVKLPVTIKFASNVSSIFVLATVLSSAIVTVVPDAEESIPLPPASVSTSLSTKISIVPLSVVMSKSC